MKYIVTYSRTALQLPDGRWSADCFLVHDRSSLPTETDSAYATRAEANIAAVVLNA